MQESLVSEEKTGKRVLEGDARNFCGILFLFPRRSVVRTTGCVHSGFNLILVASSGGEHKRGLRFLSLCFIEEPGDSSENASILDCGRVHCP